MRHATEVAAMASNHRILLIKDCKVAGEDDCNYNPKCPAPSDSMKMQKKVEVISTTSSVSGIMDVAILGGRKMEAALRFSSLGLEGRSKETKILWECFRKAESGVSRELVMLGGAAGSGKSALTKWLETEASNKEGAICL